MARKDHKTEGPEHPGRILLKRAMEPLGISRNQLARDIDVPVGRISDITNGKRGITADTALRLGRYFGTAPELWLRLQADYDLHVARSTVWPGIAPRVRALNEAAPGPDPAASAPRDTAPAAEDDEDEAAAVPAADASPVAEPEPGSEAADLVIPPAPEH